MRKRAEKADYVLAHEFCSGHKPELERDKICGCFYCLRIFHPSEIEDWIFDDEGPDFRGTAICPFCGVDSVLGESSGFPITGQLLQSMNKYWM